MVLKQLADNYYYTGKHHHENKIHQAIFSCRDNRDNGHKLRPTKKPYHTAAKPNRRAIISQPHHALIISALVKVIAN
jgi:hypothetical protein